MKTNTKPPISNQKRTIFDQAVLKKLLGFVSLIIFNCQALAIDENYLLTADRSSLYSILGEPLDKLDNSLTGKSIWTYKNFKLLLRGDQVIQVKNLTSVSQLSFDSKQSDRQPSPKKAIPLNDIMQELEAKTNLKTPKNNFSNSSNILPNNLNPFPSNGANNLRFNTLESDISKFR